MSKSRSLGVLAVLIVILVSACGAETVDDTTTQPVPTTTEPAPTTTQPAPTTTEPAPTTTEPAPTTAVPADPAAWALTAAPHRGENDTQFTYQCPPGGPNYSVWGTGIYTDDSSVCSAGVHAGVITVEDGGDVIIEIRPGQESYTASSANGVNSGSWGVWTGSFVVVG
ncbi:MAG TPA: LCCL domain-containing protein [Acidimicrobiia bacterium]|nr:LCCL domain-containing protein [Acidimicrobiia bacterium]